MFACAASSGADHQREMKDRLRNVRADDSRGRFLSGIRWKLRLTISNQAQQGQEWPLRSKTDAASFPPCSRRDSQSAQHPDLASLEGLSGGWAETPAWRYEFWLARLGMRKFWHWKPQPYVCITWHVNPARCECS